MYQIYGMWLLIQALTSTSSGFGWEMISHIQLYYSDIIMSTMASQTTSLTIFFSTVYSGADQRKHQGSASLAFVRGIHRCTGKFPTQRASNTKNVSIRWRHHVRNRIHGLISQHTEATTKCQYAEDDTLKCTLLNAKMHIDWMLKFVDICS